MSKKNPKNKSATKAAGQKAKPKAARSSRPKTTASAGSKADRSSKTRTRKREVSPPKRPASRAAKSELPRPRLGLTVPLYDEEGNVQTVAKNLLRSFRTAGVPLQLVLVDNGSRDGTRALVQQMETDEEEILGVYLDANEGYGGGILSGMARLDSSCEIVGYMWGDAQIEASDVLRIYRRLVTEGADLAKARRVERYDGWRRTVVTRVYNTVTLWLFHVTSPDTNGCPKLFTKKAWDRLTPSSRDWFLDPEIMIGIAGQGMKLAEVDVLAKPRSAGRSKVGTATVAEFCVNLVKARLRD